ncbi:hypothetical protein JQT66_16170 [Sulfitobacter mediterraneus]|nr:hypothetical protein [Sulfitobacter mediterraneus]MBM1311777.1 hypothetical protein [Sulfitobacter mediterraneus]MBM1315659.1 hypothetical protein [Sulfitobacter mediterraneus]MBM1324020.1 hypothetical protein [Sulfitobacter mediterraneus]MBM1407052.1 hypothetical protein [Sulfitobacter mediterraneus]MBM1410939.1 hypothetical protein [Sulfitobacter mediterraneus]
MIGSANEVMNLAAKAARGGGAPVAQAYAFGRAAACHLIAERPAADLDTALDALPKGPILDLPLLLMACAEARQNEAVIPGGPLPDLTLSYAQSQSFACTATRSGSQITLSQTFDQPAAQLPIKRVMLPDALAAKMQALAAGLLVPETEASRRAGAGAGLTDND